MADQTHPFLAPFDLDVTLRDAALDDQNRPTRRMLANAAIGIHVEDAYYSVGAARGSELDSHRRTGRQVLACLDPEQSGG